MIGKVADIAGNAVHEGRSTGHFVANTLNTVATANSSDIANTADTEHPRKDRSKDQIPAPEGRGRPRQVVQKLQLPGTRFSLDCPPLSNYSIDTAN